MRRGAAEIEPDEDVLGDAVAFAGVAQYPARVKCALLGWIGLQGRARRSPTGVAVTSEGGHGDEETVVRGTATHARAPAQRAEAASIDDVEEAMRDVVDPELGINVVDLGLVYGVTIGQRRASPSST